MIVISSHGTRLEDAGHSVVLYFLFFWRRVHEFKLQNIYEGSSGQGKAQYNNRCLFKSLK